MKLSPSHIAIIFNIKYDEKSKYNLYNEDDFGNDRDTERKIPKKILYQFTI